MNLISLFLKLAHPLFIRGTGRFHPHDTGIITENLSCIRQNDVNIWFYRKGRVVIAIDAGHHTDQAFWEELEGISLDNEDIDAVFLTHADPDHVGGLLSETPFALGAEIFIHEEEEPFLLGTGIRQQFGPFSFPSPVVYEGHYDLFEDEDTFRIGGIEVKCYHIPGHTTGHTAFLVDETYLFTGDAIAINHYGGHCFFNFYNMDTEENIQSLQRLKAELSDKKIQYIVTAHHGLCNVEAGFSHIDEVARASRQHPFDPMAPYDVYKTTKKPPEP